MQSTWSASTIALRISPLARLVGRHAAVGQHEAGDAGWRQVVNEMLDPGEVGVPARWRPVLPAHVLAQALPAPVAVIERRVGQDEIGLQILVEVAVEAAGVLLAEIAVDAADREIHLRQAPGRVIRLLAVDGNVPQLAPWASTNFSLCTNMPPDPQHGSKIRPL